MDIVSRGEIGSRRSDLVEAQELTQSQRKRRKQEESEYAPALDVTDIVTECDKAGERKAALVELDNPPARSQANSDSAHNEQLLKTKKHLTVFLSEREKQN